jgi:hypothetical protein
VAGKYVRVAVVDDFVMKMIDEEEGHVMGVE